VDSYEPKLLVMWVCIRSVRSKYNGNGTISIVVGNNGSIGSSVGNGSICPSESDDSKMIVKSGFGVHSSKSVFAWL
jgi:hypothetical protein